MKKDELQSEIRSVIELGMEAIEHESTTSGTISGPSFTKFISKSKILLKRHLHNHELYLEMNNAINSNDISKVDSVRSLLNCFRCIEEDDFYFNNTFMELNNMNYNNKKVFIVHGHDIGRRDEVEQLLRRIGLEPVIIMNEASRSLAIIEKIERYSNVGYGIIIYSGCDQGKEKGSNKKYRLRARQNVVFEHGYLMSKLGRGNVVALVENGVEIPGDLSGLVYISFDEINWKMQLMRELKDAGFEFDATKA